MSEGTASGRRVFVALVPPLELSRELVRRAGLALAEVARELRLYPAEHLHVTLCFLGELSEARLLGPERGRDGAPERGLEPSLERGLERGLEAALARAAAGSAPLALCIGGSGGFPDARAARVLWAGVDDDPRGGRPGALAALQRELAAVGLAPRDQGRAFRPHLTLARPRSPAGLALPAALRALALELRWTARELVLIESRLERPGVERYPVLARHAFGGTR